MANAEYLARLRQGVEVWNQWRVQDFAVRPNLNGAYLSKRNICLKGINLSRAELKGVHLMGANLRQSDLSNTNLKSADLRRADLRGVDLRGSNLSYANLLHADLRGSNLSGAKLFKARLDNANLSEANLSDSQLVTAQLLRTRLNHAILTGACIENWHINGETRLDGVICNYIYFKVDQQERRPREGSFHPGEFTALFQQAVDTVDLIYKDGIDWQAFFQSFQDLRSQYSDQDLSIQGIEKKRGGAFVVRVEVAEDADKKSIESSAKELYETKLALMEQRYRDVLQAKDGEIIAYREQSTNLMEIIKLQSVRPPMTEIPKYDLRGAQFAGGFAETVQGDQIGGINNNAAAETPSLVEAAAEIQNLLKQLEASNPTATEADQTAFLNVMIPPTKRDRFIGVLKAASGAAIEEVPYGAVLKALVEGWQKPGG